MMWQAYCITGGTITIRTRNVNLGPDQSGDRPGLQAGSYALLAVHDTGRGMDGDTLARIFDPYFSTKDKTRGTGLGLSTVYGIVKQHEGWINVYSKPGYGSIFEIYLPAISQKPSSRQKKMPSLKGFQGSGERVLVVEDDEGGAPFYQKGP